MSEKKVLTSAEALDVLNEGVGDSNDKNEFTYLKSGDQYTVKVPGINMVSEYVYGSFAKKINSFIAKEASKKSAKGFPVENLTPFDKAWKHFKDKSEDWQDENSQEAGHYRCQRKFTFGFYDLDSGNPIMVEFTRNQANAIVSAIKKYEERLDKFAFELSKQGSGTSTTVSLSIIPMLEDLTDKQKANFDKLPNDFDTGNFNGLYYEADEAEQLELLTQAGFDITLIGYGKDEAKTDAGQADSVADIEDSQLPF